MSAHRSSLIVVGVDGRPAADRALDWALDLAEKTGATIEVVTAYEDDAESKDAVGGSAGAEAQRVTRLQRDVVERALAGRPQAAVVAMQVVEGEPGRVLAAASRRADLLVLGSHGHKLAYEIAVGSTSEYCSRNARCPVVVIPAPVFDERRRHDAITVAP